MEQHNSNQSNISEHVLEAIKVGQVRMRPRWYFTLKTALLIFGAILAILALLYVVSFIIFMERLTGAGFAPANGLHGWAVFFRTLPWLLVLVATAFIITLEILVRRYAFAYRRPLLYSAAGIVVITFVGGFLIAETPLHVELLSYAQRNHSFFGGERLYRYADEQQIAEIHRGLIVATTSEGFIIQNRRGATTTVVLSRAVLPFVTDQMIPGAPLIIFGEDENNVIQAVGLRVPPPRFRPLLAPLMP